MSHPDAAADVPSPVDFHDPSEAADWAATAMAKRPWRRAFLRCFVDELRAFVSADARILELGSGPGFLARELLESLPRADYTALDFSAAMHALAKERLGSWAERVEFVEADFKRSDWTARLSSYDAVVTLQSVHELRHKRHAPSLYAAVRALLRPGGLFLVCDHVRGDSGSAADASLYMSLLEHQHALGEAGFSAHEVHREGGMALYRARPKV